ncbi:MAG: hypothetical protein Fur0016_27560 [Anaerolineales bacterium]
MPERRTTPRRKFSYYMRVMDDVTEQLVGHLADISPRGFKLDCSQAFPDEKDFRLRMDLTSDISDKPYIVFTARSKWCKPDSTEPFVYNVGFEIINISLSDGKIFQTIVEKYGSPESRW